MSPKLDGAEAGVDALSDCEFGVWSGEIEAGDCDFAVYVGLGFAVYNSVCFNK